MPKSSNYVEVVPTSMALHCILARSTACEEDHTSQDGIKIRIISCYSRTYYSHYSYYIYIYNYIYIHWVSLGQRKYLKSKYSRSKSLSLKTQRKRSAYTCASLWNCALCKFSRQQAPKATHYTLQSVQNSSSSSSWCWCFWLWCSSAFSWCQEARSAISLSYSSTAFQCSWKLLWIRSKKRGILQIVEIHPRLVSEDNRAAWLACVKQPCSTNIIVHHNIFDPGHWWHI